MIFYLVVRLTAWLWCYSWPIRIEMVRGVCAMFSALEIMAVLVAVAALFQLFHDSRKKGGAK